MWQYLKKHTPINFQAIYLRNKVQNSEKENKNTHYNYI